VLRFGVTGDDVIELKKLLIRKEYSQGITISTSASKNYFASTERAVESLSEGFRLNCGWPSGKADNYGTGRRLEG
jgi:hypothetical protein